MTWSIVDNALTALGAASAVPVRVYLGDSSGDPVAPVYGPGGVLLTDDWVTVAADGIITIADLIQNTAGDSNLSPSTGVYYWVEAGDVVIGPLEGADDDELTFAQALVDDPDGLTSVVIDQQAGQPGGLATLDGSGNLTAAQAPAHADITGRTTADAHPATAVSVDAVDGLDATTTQAAVAEVAALTFKRNPTGGRVGITGDSNPVGNNAPTANLTGRPVEQSWATQLVYGSGGRLQWGINAAVAGTTTADLDGQLDTVLADDVDLVIVSHGTNDESVDALTVDESAANIMAGITRIRTAGKTPWLVTPPPRADAYADQVAQLAAWERDYASRNPDVIFSDLHQVLSAAAGGLATAYGIQSQSPVIHLTPAGARAAALQLLEDADGRIPAAAAVQLPRSKVEPGDMLAGAGVMTALTVNVPNGWTPMATVEHTGNTVCSLVEPDVWDPMAGKWYRVAKTGSAVYSGAYLTLDPSLWDAGQDLEIVGRVRIDADLSGGQARVYLFGTPSGAYGWYLQPVWELAGECDWIFTLRGTIPATVTALLLRREVNLLPGEVSITGTVDFGDVTVINRSTAGWE